MSADKVTQEPPLDLAAWRNVPNGLLGVGAVLALVGVLVDARQFGYAWLQAYMFFLSLCLGGLFLTLAHHLFDASWSVPFRRLNEHLASLFPVMAVLFIPIAVLAPKLYPWIAMLKGGQTDHALHAKYPLFTIPMFYILSAGCLGVWILLGNRLRALSLRQDTEGGDACTEAMRVTSYLGIFLFAFSTTLAAILWMKAIHHQWFSTMYGVCYFAGSVWLTLITVYVVSVVLKRQGPLREVVREKQLYFLGSLFFAFTVFYAYVTFSQYFIIWNANMPEETFYYLLREKGTWWDVGQIVIFGHFFLPFLLLLRIDFKLKLAVMVPLCVWAWLMHFFDMSFNVMPNARPEGFVSVYLWMDVGCMAFFGGLLSKVFLQRLAAHPAFPVRDPRLAEGLDIQLPADTARAPAKS